MLGINIYLFISGLIAIAFIISFFSQRMLLKLSYKYGLFDYRDGRKLAKTPRPRLGGFGIFFGYLVATYLFVLVVYLQNVKLSIAKSYTIFLYLGAVIFIFILGLIDDFYGLKAFPKLIVEFSLASIFYVIGFQIKLVSIPFSSGQINLAPYSFPLTVLWIVGIINAVNLIDGLDGLAGGIVAFSSLTTILILLFDQQFTYAILLAPLLGGILGFLPYNFYPSKIFMGDGGSLFCGVLLSTIILKTSQKASLGLSLVVPLAILALPILDTCLAFFRRTLNGAHPFKPDFDHIHHRLLKKGFSEKQTVTIMLAITGFFSAMGLVFYSSSYKIRSFMFVIFFCIILCILWYLEYFKVKNKNQ